MESESQKWPINSSQEYFRPGDFGPNLTTLGVGRGAPPCMDMYVRVWTPCMEGSP